MSRGRGSSNRLRINFDGERTGRIQHVGIEIGGGIAEIKAEVIRTALEPKAGYGAGGRGRAVCAGEGHRDVENVERRYGATFLGECPAH